MSLAFLHVNPRAGNAVSPVAAAVSAAGAQFELRDGWNVAASFGDAAGEAAALADSVGVADLSHLSKLELHGEVTGDFGAARLEAGAWWCPVTPHRQLVVGEAGAVAAVHEREPAALDVTSAFGALVIAGPLARETFARFCALDLREQSLAVNGFRPGSVARTPAFVLREGPQRFLVLFGAAYGEYLWEVAVDAATHLGGRPVGVDVLEGVATNA